MEAYLLLMCVIVMLLIWIIHNVRADLQAANDEKRRIDHINKLASRPSERVNFNFDLHSLILSMLAARVTLAIQAIQTGSVDAGHIRDLSQAALFGDGRASAVLGKINATATQQQGLALALLTHAEHCGVKRAILDPEYSALKRKRSIAESAKAEAERYRIATLTARSDPLGVLYDNSWLKPLSARARSS